MNCPCVACNNGVLVSETAHDLLLAAAMDPSNIRARSVWDWSEARKTNEQTIRDGLTNKAYRKIYGRPGSNDTGPK